jgi:hypothetical protein
MCVSQRISNSFSSQSITVRDTRTPYDPAVASVGGDSLCIVDCDQLSAETANSASLVEMARKAIVWYREEETEFQSLLWLQTGGQSLIITAGMPSNANSHIPSIHAHSYIFMSTHIHFTRTHESASALRFRSLSIVATGYSPFIRFYFADDLVFKRQRPRKNEIRSEQQNTRSLAWVQSNSWLLSASPLLLAYMYSRP